jgi:hypothetical protein
MLTYVSEPWWWKQYARLKRRSTSTWLYGSTSQMTLNFILAAMRTLNRTNKLQIVMEIIAVMDPSHTYINVVADFGRRRFIGEFPLKLHREFLSQAIICAMREWRFTDRLCIGVWLFIFTICLVACPSFHWEVSINSEHKWKLTPRTVMHLHL